MMGIIMRNFLMIKSLFFMFNGDVILSKGLVSSDCKDGLFLKNMIKKTFGLDRLCL